LRVSAIDAGQLNAQHDQSLVYVTLADLAVYVGWGRVRVFVNRNGSMADYWQSPDLGQAAFNLALADFDQDGFDDIFVGTFSDGALRIYRNKHGAGFDPWWQASVPGMGYTGSVADLNGDGYPDLIVGEKNRIRIFINRIRIPRITHLSLADGATVTWSALPGKTYRVQFKTYPNDSSWTNLSGDVIADTHYANKTDNMVASGSQRFYRVVELR
jgi:hypothetical protein